MLGNTVRGLELPHVAAVGCKMTVGTVENVESSLAVDAPQICADFVRPTDGKARGFPLTHRPNSRTTSSWDTLSRWRVKRGRDPAPPLSPV